MIQMLILRSEYEVDGIFAERWSMLNAKMGGREKAKERQELKAKEREGECVCESEHLPYYHWRLW